MSRFTPLLVSLAAIAFAWGSAGASADQNGQPVARVVRQYALTSANDFPQRDPRDWQLLGSNDGGSTWTTLDVRKGELFGQRHQRRLFKVADSRPFNVYRLQIERVRNPAVADCVQLAELEPLGATEDDLEPAPLPEDLITAQEDNPPLETRWKVFDGRVETKWLDHAARNSATRASWIQWQYTSPADLVITNVGRLLALRNRAGRGYAVRIEGVVAGRLPSPNAWCLWDTTGALELPAGADGEPLFPGERVLVEGRSEWTNGAVGISRREYRNLGGKIAAKPKPIMPEQPMAPEDDLQWVQAEGRIQFCSWTDNHWVLELAENGRSLAVYVLHSQATQSPPASGALVRVTGICGGLLNGAGERVAATLWAPSLEAIQPVAPGSAWTNAPVSPQSVPGTNVTALLTSIEQIRRLRPEELLRHPRVRVRGVVTELFGAYIQEGAAGVEVWYAGQPGATSPRFRSCVEVEARGDWANGHGPIIRAERVTVLGPGKLPEPERSTWSELASGRMVDQWVEIEAVVHSTDGSHLLLNSEGGQFMATIRAAPAPAVRKLVDATVRIRGVCVAATDSRGRMQGIQLLVPSLECVEVAQVPAEPFALPVLPIGSLLQVRGPQEFIHRVRVRGVLTYREDRRYFLQDATGGAMAVPQEEVVLNMPAGGWSWMFGQSAGSSATPPEELQLERGDHLEVVGFPEMRGYSPVLTEVLVRKVTSTNTVAPVKATVKDIVGGGLDATLVTMEAVVLRQETVGEHCVLELQSGERAFQALLPAKGRRAPAIAPGSRVRLTGICQVEPAPFSELGRRMASFKLMVGSLADLVVLERPSWWTLKRALVVAGALLVVLAIAGGWIGILRRQVEERTRQLQQEIAEHEKTEARLGEETRRVQAEIQERRRIEAEVEKGHKQLVKASRLAGMAEVATSVLHNVGNVLNSANVLGSAIQEQVQRSKAPSVGRLAALLGEHRAELGRFVTEDGRGQQLPGYVERLAGHLEKEQEQLLDKTKALTESLQHIKEIVAMQQSYARVFGVLERVSLAEVVEDALRMHHEAMARHQIQVVRDYQDVPAVTADRHKVLQVLFNLLENAKYACEDSAKPEKQVTVTLHQNGAGRIQVSVGDNGIGIPAENLTRIFVQEFSTRKGGHGFGLHSSLLTAQEMGGSLRANSDGPGKGAVFVLELPASARDMTNDPGQMTKQ
ncbi:MAG TPA: ATP-binding protein [Candidatus Acidoferrum sp.]|nr:ATP-binding protein [Candidatus Acidoferrum sp.]